MLERVAAHADLWEVNLPPLATRVAAAAATLAEACGRLGRDPDEIGRSLWIFTRICSAPDHAASLREYRRLNPWFDGIPDHEIAAGLVLGNADECRRRLAELRDELALDLPVVDLSGLAVGPARRLLEGLAPSNSPIDAGT